MKIWVGLTDKQWFDYQASQMPDELNFWQPGGTSNFRALNPGEPFLFKLHSPNNYIVGGGLFINHSILPLSLAWQAFEQKNGTATYEELRAKILKYRQKRQMVEPDPMIGCIVLSKPFFFTKDEWIPIPSSWSPNIVQGKTYNANETEGQALWAQVEERLKRRQDLLITTKDTIQLEDKPLYGSEYLTRARLGQGAFRLLVTGAYNRKCAITGEKTLPVLEAAHIKPYARSGPNKINNGLLLRSDLHKLFDAGYLTVNQDLQVEISEHIKEKYENGREYYALHGKRLPNIPDHPNQIPDKQFIEWHNENVFVA